MDEEWVGPEELLNALDGSLYNRNDLWSKQQAISRRIRGKQMAVIADTVLINGEISGQTVPHELWTTKEKRDEDWIRGDFAAGIRFDMTGFEAEGMRVSYHLAKWTGRITALEAR